MKSYSIDFRQKIIDIREQEKMPIRALAARFSVRHRDILIRSECRPRNYLLII